MLYFTFEGSIRCYVTFRNQVDITLQLLVTKMYVHSIKYHGYVRVYFLGKCILHYRGSKIHVER